MPEFLPGAVFSGLATVVFVIVLRVRAGRPRLPVGKLALIAIAAAFVIPWALALAAEAWRATPAPARFAHRHLRPGVRRRFGCALCARPQPSH